VFVSAVAGLIAVAAISPIVQMLFIRDATLAKGFLMASLMLVAVGVVDDWHGMRGRHKLFAQILAALLLTSQGLEIRQLELLGWTIDLGVMAVPFTVFWLLGAINALNLLDGIDGLVATVGLMTSLLVACIGIISGQAFAALMSVALAGGCLAFLHANLPPARMFLGDAGSMFLGLALGTLTAVSCSNGPGLLSLAPAVGLLALPILDSGVALLRRRLTGRSIYSADRGHLHHCLLHELTSHRAVLLVAAVACLASGLGALLSVYMKNDVTAILSTGLMVIILIVMRLFGHVECSLMLSRLPIPSWWYSRNGEAEKNGKGTARTTAVRLQGERQWNLLWESLTECADKLHLLRIDLDVNLPAMREGFHANWYQPTERERHECWRMEIPLFVDGAAVGRLQVSGEHRAEQKSVCDAVDQLIDLLEPFERAFADIAARPESSHDADPGAFAPLVNRESDAHVSAKSGFDTLIPTARADVASLRT
jgi:UDP-GlcNAc:undecaprenyl-phosphate GlcNAc-1-phosphate transferase